ncbi:hypothetical protein [Halopseudomonas pelagia]|uniref:hypothetical protein n=1 Tax=Halopseudomonas pelagia TaxID=553151 RepID=UPI0003A0F30C|nr:hypothetical protein [Halopseudomonas pelagia]|tara:strand:- start:371 stop:718 length:348 start_codon:yes stop_codon:yes gene_type:complete
MKRLRLALTVLLCGLLLSFNTLAVSLLAIERCVDGMDREPAEMHHDCVGDAGEAGWLESTAGLLCDSGVDCQLGGAVLTGPATLAVSPFPRPARVTELVTSRITQPDTFWRPPRD